MIYFIESKKLLVKLTAMKLHPIVGCLKKYLTENNISVHFVTSFRLNGVKNVLSITHSTATTP